MYQPCSTITTPDDGTFIRRYMDFPKFIDLLSSRTLFFSRADTMPDQWEGYHPAWPLRDPLLMKSHVAIWEDMRTTTFLSCWHKGVNESAAMWQIYSLQGQGIAVCSSIGQLKRSLESAPQPIHIGNVVYDLFDFENPHFTPSVSEPDMWCKKKLPYEFENEVRAIIDSRADAASPGINVPVDLTILVESVILAPTAPLWYAKQLRWLLDKANLESVPIEPSSLSTRPKSYSELQ